MAASKMTHEERNQLVDEIAQWLQHIDRLGEIQGASGLVSLGLNPLWDAAEMIKAKFKTAEVYDGR